MISRKEAFKAMESIDSYALNSELAEYFITDDTVVAKTDTKQPRKYKLKDKNRFKQRPVKKSQKHPYFIKYPKKDKKQNRDFDKVHEETIDRADTSPGINLRIGFVSG